MRPDAHRTATSDRLPTLRGPHVAPLFRSPPLPLVTTRRPPRPQMEARWRRYLLRPAPLLQHGSGLLSFGTSTAFDGGYGEVQVPYDAAPPTCARVRRRLRRGAGPARRRFQGLARPGVRVHVLGQLQGQEAKILLLYILCRKDFNTACSASSGCVLMSEILSRVQRSSKQQVVKANETVESRLREVSDCV